MRLWDSPKLGEASGDSGVAANDDSFDFEKEKKSVILRGEELPKEGELPITGELAGEEPICGYRSGLDPNRVDVPFPRGQSLSLGGVFIDGLPWVHRFSNGQRGSGASTVTMAPPVASSAILSWAPFETETDLIYVTVNTGFLKGVISPEW